MSATDALTITSALDALTRYYEAKEREESVVLYINDAYLEALNSLEKLESENAKLRKQGERLFDKTLELGTDNAKLREENERFIVKLNAEHIARQNVESDNAKLRELVRLMWKPFCWAQSSYEVCLTDEQEDEIREKVRELGVEVSA